MDLSTHQDHQPSATVFWSIGLIIVASAVLAVFVEPHWPDITARGWTSHSAVATVRAEATIRANANTTTGSQSPGTR